MPAAGSPSRPHPHQEVPAGAATTIFPHTSPLQAVPGCEGWSSPGRAAAAVKGESSTGYIRIAAGSCEHNIVGHDDFDGLQLRARHDKDLQVRVLFTLEGLYCKGAVEGSHSSRSFLSRACAAEGRHTGRAAQPHLRMCSCPAVHLPRLSGSALGTGNPSRGGGGGGGGGHPPPHRRAVMFGGDGSRRQRRSCPGGVDRSLALRRLGWPAGGARTRLRQRMKSTSHDTGKLCRSHTRLVRRTSGNRHNQ